MKTKIFTALILVVLLLGVLVIPQPVGQYVWLGLMALIGFVAIGEYINLFGINEGNRKIKTLGYSAVLIFFLYNAYSLIFDDLRLNIGIPVLIILIIFSLLLLGAKNDGLRNINKLLYGVLYIGGGFASLIFLRQLGLSLLLYTLAIGICTDTFAQWGGMLLGRHKLCPEISPNKTIEGAICGTIGGTAAGFLFGYFLGVLTPSNNYLSTLINPEHYEQVFDFLFFESSTASFLFLLFASFGASLASQAGDLIASRIKRHYQVKDFGKIIPGHGGVLDRFDSLIFSGLCIILMITIFRL
jgi:phosphatidate cytidylyltransferase